MTRWERALEKTKKFTKPFEEVIGFREASTPQGSSSSWIGAGGASEAEIHPARMQRFEHAELFGNG
jgi:hypothetical protein